MNKIISFNPIDNIKARKHRREKIFRGSVEVIVFDAKKRQPHRRFRNVISLRMYGNKSASYACLWIIDNDRSGVYATGSGLASGFGYHRPSTAAEIALEFAGIRFKEEIGGRGDEHVKNALSLVMKKLGYKKSEFTILDVFP